VKEWFHGVADALFVVVALAAAVGGVFRGHLLFTERTYDRPRVLAELRRAGGVLTTVDLTIALALVSEGVWATGGRPVGGVLIAALGIGFAVARWWIERNTTEAAFGGERGHADTGPS
jgi:hypothetical protein